MKKPSGFFFCWENPDSGGGTGEASLPGPADIGRIREHEHEAGDRGMRMIPEDSGSARARSCPISQQKPEIRTGYALTPQ